MEFLKRAFCFIYISMFVQSIYSQTITHVALFDNLLFNTTEFVKTDSGLIINHYYKNPCKSYSVKTEFMPYSIIVPVEHIATIPAEPKSKLITIHGNISYNFLYRSQVDTPFAESNVMQHFVQTNLNVLIKDKYPTRIIISNRNSNSAYFKNAMDVNVKFNRSDLLENIKKDLKEKAIGFVKATAIHLAEQQYKDELTHADQLKAWLNSSARTQELVEEKERMIRQTTAANFNTAYANNLPSSNELNSLSSLKQNTENKFQKNKFSKLVSEEVIGTLKQHVLIDSSILKKYNGKKEELIQLGKRIQQSAIKINQLKKSILDSVNHIKGEINNLKSGPALFAFMKKNGISKNDLTNGQKILLSVNQIGIGRTWVDYSELTVKNISLGGVNVEVNPLPYYFAFAAGKVNYRFRDFIIKGNNALPDQSLYLFRAGIGQKEKNNLIFTFYDGKKSILNYTPSNSLASIQKILGISAEAKLALNENNYIIAEIAKSSFQNAGTQVPTGELIRKIFNWKVHSNEAYSIKLFSQYPQTDTKVTGYYKKTGENFQSFNLYPMNISQDAYMLRLNQYAWKRKIAIDAAIRKNDFVSPVAAPSFSNKTIFKSIQASIRIKKYPFVSVGYYPSSQLSLSNNNLLVENQYNTLNAIMSYSYQVKKTGMNTNAVFTKFYNSSSDTGFIYFNASSYSVNQSFFITPFMIQGSVSIINQKGIQLTTIEPLLSYQYRNCITLSGSFKWNRLNNFQNLFGGTAAINFYLKKLGTIQLNYDKTYLPGSNTILKPVDIGRASFYREF